MIQSWVNFIGRKSLSRKDEHSAKILDEISVYISTVGSASSGTMTTREVLEVAKEGLKHLQWLRESLSAFPISGARFFSSHPIFARTYIDFLTGELNSVMNSLAIDAKSIIEKDHQERMDDLKMEHALQIIELEAKFSHELEQLDSITPMKRLPSPE
ncbi:hypothetical protein VCHA53O466_40020 [Vibrio chagasii]|nr:hypothetical protein VCHA53O466_40020 [Vibrio chagasii]